MRGWWCWGLVVLFACRSDERAARFAALRAAEDRRVLEVESWESWLGDRTDDALRARAARAIGRLREPSMGLVLRRALRVEREPAVREELVFALGQSGDVESIPLLLELRDDPEPGLRARAIEALGKLRDRGVVAALIGDLSDEETVVRGAALLAVVRLQGRRVADVPPLDAPTARMLLQRVQALLRDPDEAIRWKAAYALAELDLPDREAALREGLGSERRLVRFFCARGLARRAGQGPLTDPAALLPVLEDPDAQVAAEAARALGAAGSEEAREALVALVGRDGRKEDFHARVAAIEALGELPGAAEDAATAELVRGALEDPSRSVRQAALVEWAELRPESAVEAVRAFAGSPDPFARVAAARAAGRLPWSVSGELLHAASEDADPRVVCAALDAMVSRDDADRSAAETVRRALRHEDLAVQGSALVGLRSVGGAEDLARIVALYPRLGGDARTELRVEAVRSADQLAGAEARDFLRSCLEDPAASVVGEARQRLGEGAPAVAAPRSRRPSWIELEAGVDVDGEAPNPRAILFTDSGRIVLELLRDEAPRHVASFRRFVQDASYSGLPFHRVVSGFVVQGLDPRGDGWGTGGAFLRDEINPVPYEAGTVGMPNTGPDSGGCQIFITHVPTPHLDGRYTVFARVIEGMDVVNALEVGDVCRSVRVED